MQIVCCCPLIGKLRATCFSKPDKSGADVTVDGFNPKNITTSTLSVSLVLFVLLYS